MPGRKLSSCFRVLTLAAAGAALSAAPALAANHANYPDRTLRVFVGQAAGGAVDTIARMVSERLSQSFGRPVVVENRPGAGGMLAAEAVARAPADGYTLGLLDVGALAVNPVLRPDVRYDVGTDFTYLGTVARIPLVLVAHPSVPAETVAELTDYSLKHPAVLNYGSAGVGSPPHMAFEAYKLRSQAPITHVAYRGGAPALSDVVAGHVQLTFIDTNLANQYARDGRVRPLAIATLQRNELLPDVPTFDEAGLADFEFSPWVGMVGPADLPPAVVSTLNEALRSVVEEAALQTRIRDIGMVPFASDGEAFGALVERDLQTYRELVREQDISIDE